MKQLEGRAQTEVEAGVEECLALLRAVDRYPQWYPERIREVAVVERGREGFPGVVRATLRVEIGPFAQDVHVLLRTVADDEGVTLMRVAHEPEDPEELEVRWRVSPGRLSVELVARLEVPRLLPVGGVGESIARGFVQAAARALAEERGSSPNASATSS